MVALWFIPPVPHDPAYHRFADQRELLGIANLWNVVSNVPFILIGLMGLRLPGGLTMKAMFLGIALIGVGSASYHWQPSDAALLWDRLPMTVAFMAIFANAIEERVHEKAGMLLLWPLILIGIGSLVMWRLTNDLRLYGWVQFFPLLALPLMFWLFPAKYTGTADWLIAAVLYVVAKAFEYYDVAVFSVGHELSGHTLKHLFAAGACLVVLRHFQTRRLIATISAQTQPLPSRAA